MISKAKLGTMICETKGKIFRVTFVKKDGAIRDMVARVGVQGQDPLKTGHAGPRNSYLNVYDMKKKGFRTINLDTVFEVNINGICSGVF